MTPSAGPSAGPRAEATPNGDTDFVSFADNHVVRELVGELGSNLKLVARPLNVELTQRGSGIVISGSGDRALARGVLEALYGLASTGRPIHPSDVRHAVRILREDPTADLAVYFHDTVLICLDGRPISPRSAGQKAYLDMLRSNDVAFGVGPAGTGKTYLAMAVAVAALLRGEVKKLILTRPAVEAGEKLGFLPGDLTEKVDPYLRPLWDALSDMLPAERLQRMLERGVIEVAPLAFMRGRTLAGAYIVLDEGQNTTRAQMKMFLTRLGEGSRMIITGDTSQIDLPRPWDSGMIQAVELLNGVDRVGISHLSVRDVVRHPVVAAIIDAYDTAARQEAAG
jgi:phosphate starvation-inducible protein PhoH and related proteins